MNRLQVAVHPAALVQVAEGGEGHGGVERCGGGVKARRLAQKVEELAAARGLLRVRVRVS